jgi:hypothetical protein
MSFGQHVCVLELDLDEQETVDFIRGLKAALGDRVRTTTRTRWLYDSERAPVPPMGKPGHFGNIRQVKTRIGAGARAQ